MVFNNSPSVYSLLDVHCKFQHEHKVSLQDGAFVGNALKTFF